MNTKVITDTLDTQIVVSYLNIIISLLDVFDDYFQIIAAASSGVSLRLNTNNIYIRLD